MVLFSLPFFLCSFQEWVEKKKVHLKLLLFASQFNNLIKRVKNRTVAVCERLLMTFEVDMIVKTSVL